MRPWSLAATSSIMALLMRCRVHGSHAAYIYLHASDSVRHVQVLSKLTVGRHGFSNSCSEPSVVKKFVLAGGIGFPVNVIDDGRLR
jgi:hypothetical protein